MNLREAFILLFLHIAVEGGTTDGKHLPGLLRADKVVLICRHGDTYLRFIIDTYIGTFYGPSLSLDSVFFNIFNHFCITVIDASAEDITRRESAFSCFSVKRTFAKSDKLCDFFTTNESLGFEVLLLVLFFVCHHSES